MSIPSKFLIVSAYAKDIQNEFYTLNSAVLAKAYFTNDITLPQSGRSDVISDACVGNDINIILYSDFSLRDLYILHIPRSEMEAVYEPSNSGKLKIIPNLSKDDIIRLNVYVVNRIKNYFHRV